MKLLKIALDQLIKEELESLQEPQVNVLYDKFKVVMDQVDPDLDYKVLAEVVALLLIEDYGTHNYKPFVAHLVSRLK